MEKLLIRKLRSTSGESIAETLVAVLIAAFALLMLAGTINSASNIIMTSKTTLDSYYMINNNLEKQSNAGESNYSVDNNGSITLKSNDNTPESLKKVSYDNIFSLKNSRNINTKIAVLFMYTDFSIFYFNLFTKNEKKFIIIYIIKHRSDLCQ